MSYNYKALRPQLFTDEGQRLFLKVRDRVRRLLRSSGAVRMQEAIHGESGGSWELLACVDRMVELGELREIPQNDFPAAQYRVFVEGANAQEDLP